VSAGFVDRAAERLSQTPSSAGFDQAMKAALLAEPVLGADGSPVTVLHADPDPDTGCRGTGTPSGPSAGSAGSPTSSRHATTV